MTRSDAAVGVEGTTLHRRSFLAFGGAALAATALTPFSALAVAPEAPIAAGPLPTWIVGTPGEADHEVIRAATREAAILFRANDCESEDDEEWIGTDGCECPGCTHRDGYIATRVEAWDGRSEDGIKAKDWLAEGFDTNCDRCGWETSRDAGGHAVGTEAVCEDCLTLADWEIVDPEIAAEKRAVLEDTPPPSLCQAGG